MGTGAVAVALAAGLGISACGGSSAPTGPDSVTVSYSMAISGTAVTDSLAYNSGHGDIVKVKPLNPGTTTVITFSLPGSLDATLYVHSTGAGKAVLRAIWTIDGNTNTDSALTVITSASHVAIQFPHHSV